MYKEMMQQIMCWCKKCLFCPHTVYTIMQKVVPILSILYIFLCKNIKSSD